jgi:hypothetical protein
MYDVLFCRHGTVEGLANFLTENLRGEWFLQEGDAFLERAVFGDV